MSFILTSTYVIVLLAASAVYFIIHPIIIYLRDENGLRRFPGLSVYSGWSNLPFIVEAHKGMRTMRLVRMHREHPVIRTGPNSLSFGDASAIKDIYGHSTQCTKDTQYILTSGSHFHVADVIDRADHARKRKILSAAYALKNLEEWEYKVADKTERMILQFDRLCTKSATSKTDISEEDLKLDYRMWTNFFTLDAIADIGLSEKLGFLDNGTDRCLARRGDGHTWEVDYRVSLYETAHKQSLLVWSYSHYKLLNKLSNVIPYYRRMSEHAYNWDGIVLERATKRLKRWRAGEKLDDFFQALMEDKKGGANNLQWGEIVAEVSIMMNAGSATTAIAMTNALLMLLKHPECYSKAQEEVDTVLDEDDRVAPYEKVKHLPYIRACLDEALRMWPPTPQGLARETPPEGTVIGGHFIPGGVTVSVPALVAHRNETVFHQADQYLPERWLGEEGRALQPYFLAFSAGARGCIGRNISYLEQTVVLATMLHRYDFALPHPDWDIERLETMNLLLGPMPVKIWRRHGSSC